jgi:hypothetical protein
MGFFKKKEVIPTLPTAQPLPALSPPQNEDPKKDLPELPSFPTGPKNDNLNREMVKSAISEEDASKENKPAVELPEKLTVNEIGKDEPMLPSRPAAAPISEPPMPKVPTHKEKSLEPKPEPKPSSIPEPPTMKAPEKIEPSIAASPKRYDEPIFVRIDKFQAAQNNFEEIKSKVVEIEAVLKEIKDIKAKEEEELKGWTSEVEDLKAKLSEIDGDIFSQL